MREISRPTSSRRVNHTTTNTYSRKRHPTANAYEYSSTLEAHILLFSSVMFQKEELMPVTPEQMSRSCLPVHPNQEGPYL